MTAEKYRGVILAEKTRVCWRRSSFNAWQIGHKVLDRFWAKVKRGSLKKGTRGKVTIAYFGDASFASSGRGSRAVPTSATRKSCDKVLQIDSGTVTEFRSSKCCAGCGKVLQRYTTTRMSQRVGRKRRAAFESYELALDMGNEDAIKPADKFPFTEIRGMRYCASAKGTCEFAGMNVHRDFNAAYSIAGEAYRRIRGMDVQAYMQRPSHAKEDAKHLLAVGGKYKRIKHVTAKEHLTKPVYRLGKNASVFQQLGEYDDDDDDDGGD